MTWIIGIDEAGYGPNLGPFVMTSIACRVPDSYRDANLWQLLRPAVRRCSDADEGQLLIDDSKLVYTGADWLVWSAASWRRSGANGSRNLPRWPN